MEKKAKKEYVMNVIGLSKEEYIRQINKLLEDVYDEDTLYFVRGILTKKVGE